MRWDLGPEIESIWLALREDGGRRRNGYLWVGGWMEGFFSPLAFRDTNFGKEARSFLFRNKAKAYMHDRWASGHRVSQSTTGYHRMRHVCDGGKASCA